MNSRWVTAIVVTAILACGGSIVGAQEKPRDPAHSLARLIAFDALQKRLGDPNLRLLDARVKSDYDSGHITGAIWIDVKSAEKLASSAERLNDRTAWERWIEPLGIGPDTEVVIYDAQRQLSAAKTWWLLSYLGVGKVALIDGGYPLWVKQGRPVTSEVPVVAPHAFPVAFRPSRHATRADVLESLKSGGHQIVDARSADEHSGKQVRSKRGGHIPSSCLLEWDTLVDADGRFLDERTIRARLRAIEVDPDKPIITHCQSGGRASVTAFVFERLGFPTRNYYLGWSDWGNADETPIEKGNRPDARK